MSGLFDDLPEASRGLFDDIPEAPPAKGSRPRWMDAADQLMADTALPEAAPTSALEGTTGPFNFKQASAVRRALEAPAGPQARGPQYLDEAPPVDDGALDALARIGRKVLNATNQGTAGIVRNVGDITGLDSVSRFAKGSADASRAYAGKTVAPDIQVGGFTPSSIVQDLPGAAEGAAVSIGTQLPAIATGNLGTALALLFGQSYGDQYSQVRDKGLDILPGMANAGLTAGFEVVGEKVGGLPGTINALKGAIAGNAPAKVAIEMLRAGARDVPGEMLTTTGQYATDALGVIGTNKNASLDELGAQLKDTVLQTVLQGGMMTGGGAGIAKASQLAGVRQPEPPIPSAADHQAMMERLFGNGQTQPPGQAPAAPTAPSAPPNVDSIVAAIEQAALAARPNRAEPDNLFSDLPETQGAKAQLNAPAITEPAPIAQADAPAAPPAGQPAIQAKADGVGQPDAPAGQSQPEQPGALTEAPNEQNATPPTAATQAQAPASEAPAAAGGDDTAAGGVPAAPGAGGVQAHGVAPILQNRNRATPSSIAQMQSIAAKPDYGRLGFSRDFANGSPVVAGGQIAPEQLGRQDFAAASDGRRIPVQYAVVEASEVLPSNQADGTPNADYGNQSVQRIRAIAGNGRIAGLQLAHRNGVTPGYMSELVSDTMHGVSPEVIRRMRAPVLVRVMPSDQVTADIGDVSNTTGSLSLSAVEQANNDAQRVDLDSLQFAQDGSITPEAVRQFVRAMPQAEQGGLVDTNGQPTKQAVDRLNAAVFAKAYGNDGLVRLFAQAQDPEARLILSALAQAAPKMARLEGLGALDIRGLVTQAAEIAVNARREGRPLASAAQQMDMAADPDVSRVLDLFARNARSIKPVVDALSRAADFAYTEGTKPAEDMFGAVPRASRADVINQLRPENERASQETLENPAGRQPVGQDAGRQAPEPAGPGAPAEVKTGRPAETEGLTSYTPEEVNQRIERLEQAEAERKAADTKAERDDAKARERRDIAQRSEAAADSFELGQNASDNLSGPGGIFGVNEPGAEYGGRQDVEVGTDENGQPTIKTSKVTLKFALRTERLEFIPTADNQQMFQLAIFSPQDDYLGTVEALFIDGKPTALYDIEVNRDTRRAGTGRAVVEALRRAAPGGSLAISNIVPAAQGFWERLGIPRQNLEEGAAYDGTIDLPLDTDQNNRPSQGAGSLPPARAGSGRSEAGQDASPYRGAEGQDGQQGGLSVEAGRRRYRDDSQLELDLERLESARLDPSQAGPEGAEARRVATGLVRDLHATGTVLAQALSGDFAARQRTNLVGQVAATPEELATLAQLYRDPRFETFRLVFTNDAGAIVSQVGLTSRMPAMTATIVGNDLFSYAREVAEAARQRGATSYFMLHNHPSGNATASTNDIKLTVRLGGAMANEGGMKLRGHVVIDTNEYTVIDRHGKPEKFKKDFGQSAPFEPGEYTGTMLTGPADVMAMAKRLDVDQDAVTFIAVDSQNVTRRVVTMPSSAITGNYGKDRLMLARHLLAARGSRLLAVTRSPGMVSKLNGLVLDAILIHPDGSKSSVAESGVLANGRLLPEDRRTRVSPDTSPEFAYLRERTMPAKEKAQRADGRVREDGAEYQSTATQSPNRDALGRVKFRRGEVALGKLDAATRPLQEAFGMRMASPELRKQLRKMKATIDQANQSATNVARHMKDMSEADRAMVSDIVEKMIAPGVVPPEHAVRVADAITKTMDRQTDELVELGMLSQDSAERWRGRYLPRIYNRKTELDIDSATDSVKNMFKTGRPTGQGIGGGSLKGRGLFEDVSVDSVDQWVAMGYEVRDPHWRLSQGKLELVDKNAPKVAQEKVTVWRDWTPSERAQMGENRDALFRYVQGYTSMQRDIAIGRLFNNIANNPDWVRRGGADGWVQVPDTEIPDTGGVKRYGNLAGLWVRKDVMSHLTRFEESANEALQIWREALGIWKEGKTALNPVAHFNNIASNTSMAHFAGVSYWDGHKYINAVRDLVNKAPMVDEARNAGLFTGSYTQEELVNSMPPELQKMMQMDEGKLRKSGRQVMNAMTFWMRTPLRNAYEFEDTYFKYLIYRDARQQGMSPEDATDYALRYIFTYDDLPSGARKVRDFAIPFFSWTYKAIPALLHTAMVYPWRFAAPAAMLNGINLIAYALAAGDEDDDWMEKIAKGQEMEKEEREVLPDRMQGKGMLYNPKSIRLGTDKVTGNPIFLDASRVVPGGDMFDMENQAGGIDIPAPLMPNHPVLSVFAAMIANKEMFMGREVVDKNDTTAEAAEKRVKWMAGFLLPAVAPGGYHSQRILDATANAMDITIKTPLGEFTGVDRSGMPVQPKFAAMQTIGIKARPVDLELEASRRKSQESAFINSIAAEVRSLARLQRRGAISDDMMGREVEKAKEKIERIRDKED